MSKLKAPRTQRIGLPMTEARSQFMDEVRVNFAQTYVNTHLIRERITAETPESTIAAAIFDAGIRALRDQAASLSYAEEAADPEYQREAAAMRRRPRGHSIAE